MASTTATASTSTPPLAETLLTRPINTQRQSPLYLLPQEIRDQIFAYALTPYTPKAPPPPPKPSALYPSTSAPRPRKPNPWNPIRAPYDINTPYSRPGQRAKVHHPTALLLVSRLTHLETAHLPVPLATHTFYAPPSSGPPDILASPEYFARMSPAQQSTVRRVRVFADVAWLLKGELEGVCAHTAMRGVTDFSLVIRWCDWRGWASNEALSLASRPVPAVQAEEEEERLQDPAEQEMEFSAPPTPMGGVEMADPMEAMTQEECADVREALESAIAQLPNLKAVSLSLEAPYVKSDELEAQLAAAREWNIRLGGKAACEEEKTVKGVVAGEAEWEAPMCAWSDFCAHCGGGIGDDKACEERKRRRCRGLGPRVLGGVVRWC
ncbi:hypothetical protein VE03_09387 [Pseudogymnoascus sp. 23342-1-I1]|nr:hypothetical protein VE03_09387 [Pseudogymnoascus sp. 23342-1-I1]